MADELSALLLQDRPADRRRAAQLEDKRQPRDRRLRYALEGARRGTTDKGQPDDKIVKEALKRFKRCATWEATARKRWIEDEKFVNGDSDNLFQWPDDTLTARGYGAASTGDQRPCLTINKTRQHVLQIINDARQNRTHIKFRPTGNGATYEAAQVFDGMVRHIEYISNAQQAYATATRFR
jgi:hypothetical protein